MLLIGTLRVVTQALHLPGRFAHQTRSVVRLSLNTVCPLAVSQNGHRKPPGQHNGRNQQGLLCQYRFNGFTISSSNLNHRPSSSLNNAARRSSPREAISAQCHNDQQRPFPPALPAGRHRAVVIRQQLTLCNQRLNRVIKPFSWATSRTSAGLSPS